MCLCRVLAGTPSVTGTCLGTGEERDESFYLPVLNGLRTGTEGPGAPIGKGMV